MTLLAAIGIPVLVGLALIAFALVDGADDGGLGEIDGFALGGAVGQDDGERHYECSFIYVRF